MKFAYIETRYEKRVVFSKSFLKKVPKKVALFTTIQFVDQIDSLKQQLEDVGLLVRLLKTAHTRKKGQLYGCNIQRFAGGFDGFVYVGDGLFHPKALLLHNEKDVFVFNPFSGKSSVLGKKDVAGLVRKQRAALGGFISASVIGVLVSTKPGQQFLKKGLELKKRFPKKKFYFVVCNSINFGGLEDFPFVECWVNTACPRIAYDDTNKFVKPVVDVWELDALSE